MAWSVLQSASATNAGSGNVSVTFSTANLTAGTKVIALVAVSCSNTTFIVTSVKDGAGNTWTLLQSKVSADFATHLGLYALDTPAGDVGTKPTITATIGTNFGANILVQEVSGLLAGNTSAMLDGTAATSTGTTSPAATGSYSTSAAGEYLLAGYGDQGLGATLGTPGGYTADTHNVTGNNLAEDAIFYKSSTGGAESASITVSAAGTWDTIIGAFQLAAGGSSPVPPPPWAPPWAPQLAQKFGPAQPFALPEIAAAPPLQAAAGGTVPPLIAVCRRLASQVSRAVTGSGAKGIQAPFPPPGGSQPHGAVARRRPARALTGSVAGKAFPNGAIQPRPTQPRGSVFTRRPARAVFAGLAAAPVLAHAVTGGMVAQRPPAHRPRAVTAHVYGAPPAAVVSGPAGSPPGGLVRRRSPARAVTARAYGRAFPNGSRPGGTSVYRRIPARAATGHAYGPAAVTPLGPAGSPPGGLVIRRQAPGGQWGGLASSRVATGAPPAGSKPGGVVARRSPARAVTGHAAGKAFPAGAQPGGTVRRRAPARAVQAGTVVRTSNAVPPRGAAQPRATVPVPRRYPARALWQRIAGAALNQRGRLQPRATVPVPRRYPARAGAWRSITGGPPPPPPPFTVGTLTAADAPQGTLTAADGPQGTLTAGTGGNALTGSTGPQGTLTAGTQRTGGPG